MILLLQLHVGLNQSRNIHGTGQNRRMRIGGALSCDKSQYPALIDLNRFTRSQIVRKQDHRFIGYDSFLSRSGKDPRHPSGNIQHIGAPCLHIVIIHGREHLREAFSGHVHRVCGVYPRTPDFLPDGIQIIPVIQHDPVHIKDHGLLFSGFLHRLLIQNIQLAAGLLSRFLKSFDLRFGIPDLFLCQDEVLFAVQVYLSGRNSF